MSRLSVVGLLCALGGMVAAVTFAEGEAPPPQSSILSLLKPGQAIAFSSVPGGYRLYLWSEAAVAEQKKTSPDAYLSRVISVQPGYVVVGEANEARRAIAANAVQEITEAGPYRVLNPERPANPK